MNALYLIDKGAGISSFGVIRALRKLHSTRKIGHAGTLDPFATGLLIVGSGQYTRLLQYAEALNKCYTATLHLGQSTSTGDPEGEVIAEAPLATGTPDFAAIRARALELKALPLPRYSAVKINGVRSYNLARKGIELDMPLRALKIYDFEVIEYTGHDLQYRVKVSRGSYVRAISQWLAEELGTVGYTKELRRTAIGNFAVESACPWEKLEMYKDYRIQPRELLTAFNEYEAPLAQQTNLVNGGSIPAPASFTDGEYAIYNSDGTLLALATKTGQSFKPHQVFSLL